MIENMLDFKDLIFTLQEWQELQQSIQRKERALLETKSKITHPVYSLYFPEVSYTQPSVFLILCRYFLFAFYLSVVCIGSNVLNVVYS